MMGSFLKFDLPLAFSTNFGRKGVLAGIHSSSGHES